MNGFKPIVSFAAEDRDTRSEQNANVFAHVREHRWSDQLEASASGGPICVHYDLARGAGLLD